MFMIIAVLLLISGYKRGNQNPYIEEEQTIQWPKERVQKDRPRSTKHTHKTKNGWHEPPKTMCQLMFFGRVICSCSTSGTVGLI
jgi:hypothetical protein